MNRAATFRMNDFDPARGLSQTIPWSVGSSDDSYGAMVWASRVYSLRGHLRIIADHLPDEAGWLRNQVAYGIAEAEKYLRDWSPLCDSESNTLTQGPRP